MVLKQKEFRNFRRLGRAMRSLARTLTRALAFMTAVIAWVVAVLDLHRHLGA